MKSSKLTRRFVFNGRTLPDPNPSLTPEQVKGVIAAQYPEATSSVVEGPTYEGGFETYHLTRSVGTKG